ncbi:mannose-P-dolichol utilization defect 1a [Pygocentrus nattereri]|uniref:Solute carrier family 66 member 3 n=1 Tax=Pygocentrus nattereri TaxID=42514 RepID=A0AAR2LTG0_PYGNA|nr:mannose-P-dolichol utilization defect 1a [Pygocentrus nattereri]
MAESGEEQASALKSFLLTYLMPEKCYERFFLRLDFAHVPCVKVVLSKVLGFWMVGTLLAPLPQIWRIFRAGSSDGLSLVSALLDLLVVSAHVAFCVHHNFPIGAWGESVWVLVQLALLVFLIQHYREDSIKGAVSLAAYSAFMYLLTSPLTPRAVVKAMYEWKVLIVIASRLVQVGCNQSAGSTGQISALSVFLLCMGSIGLTHTSIQDSGHSLHSQACVLSSCCSALLLLQVLLFRNHQLDGERQRDGGRERRRDREREKKKEE